MSYSEDEFYRGLEEIEDGLQAGNVFIRLTDSNSITRLDDDGFVCSHDRQEGTIPTGRSYEIARHINGGWRGYGAGGVSPWISATKDLEWAVWEICRRLVVLHRPWVEMSVINSPDHYHKSYRGARLVRVDTQMVVQMLEQEGTEYCQQAANFARAASEVLFFKRVFAKDVWNTYEWTKMNLPIDLPECFWKPVKQRQPRTTWVDWLVWDPRDSDRGFYYAEQLIANRRDQLATSRGFR
ncbi:hypothetical protein IAT38_003908 [Cryptococcus sp. DSM 104549]